VLRGNSVYVLKRLRQITPANQSKTFIYRRQTAPRRFVSHLEMLSSIKANNGRGQLSRYTVIVSGRDIG